MMILYNKSSVDVAYSGNTPNKTLSPDVSTNGNDSGFSIVQRLAETGATHELVIFSGITCKSCFDCPWRHSSDD